MPGTMSDSSKYLLVASIDFGTTCSGYACSFRGKADDIRLKNWGDSQGHLAYKTPTSVLLDKNGKFEAFGFEAEERYIEEDEEENGACNKTKQLFKHFKMVLHKREKTTLKATIASVAGDICPAIDIFTHAIRYLKEHLIEETSKDLTCTLEPDMIQWVITVPAIWSDESKQFMREAAFRSGCIKSKDSNQLIIALEPEAASFYCRKSARFQNNADELSFPSGTRYLVLDCGGGTNDMVLHEVVLDYKVKEICAVTGGSKGGNRVNDAFIALLKELLSSEYIDSFRLEFPQQWFMLMSKFEKAKKAFNDKRVRDAKMNIELPYAMEGSYNTQNRGQTFKSVLCSRKEDKGISFSNGILVLSFDAVRNLFSETVDQIVDDIRSMLNETNTGEPYHIHYILMVGGFCESGFLQTAIEQEFVPKGVKVLKPSEAQLAIVKGAVLFARNQDQVVTRIAKYTYGTYAEIAFQKGIHDESRLYVDEEGYKRCRGAILIFIEKGSPIDVGSSIEQKYQYLAEESSAMVDIYAIDRKPRKAEYVDSPGVRKLGILTIESPERKDSRTKCDTQNDSHYFRVKMTFGSTEILVESIDESTGKVCSTTIDFLSG